MAETNKLTTFVLDGTTLDIVDPTARSSAETATRNANTALSTAQTAESKAATAQSTAINSRVREGVERAYYNDRNALDFLMEV